LVNFADECIESEKMTKGMSHLAIADADDEEAALM
jgi:hypothetical protein